MRGVKENPMIRVVLMWIAAMFVAAGFAQAAPKHGFAMQGEPALPPDFKHLPYVNPDAPQGGQLRRAEVGTFDALNPFVVKGTAAREIRTFTIESLMGRNGAVMCQRIVSRSHSKFARMRNFQMAHLSQQKTSSLALKRCATRAAQISKAILER
jgi:hypothetical protein